MEGSSSNLNTDDPLESAEARLAVNSARTNRVYPIDKLEPYK